MQNGNYGVCVAGFTAYGKWVRLVSDESGDSLPDSECKSFECLDIIEVDTTEVPLKYQPENVKLERLNRKIGRLSIEKVIDSFGVSDDAHCFVNNRHLLYENEMKHTSGSLMLVEAKNLRVYKDDKNSYKAAFEYKGTLYEGISMTAPHYYKEASYSNAYIVVSLPPDTGVYRGFYKFVAAIYPIEN